MDGDSIAAGGLSPGLRLTLTHTETSDVSRARVLAVTPAHLSVKPLNHDQVIRCAAGDAVEATFAVAGDATYRFLTSVLALDELTWRLAVPSAVRRSQLRAHDRVDVDIELDGMAATARVVDVSAGGIGVLSHANWPLGTVVRTRCALPTPTGEIHIDADAEVVRCTAVVAPGAGGSSSLFGLAYRGLAAPAREQIGSAVRWMMTSRSAAAVS